MRQILREKTTYADCRATESLCSETKTFSHTIKQLCYQYHKTLDFYNIKGVPLEYCTQPVFCGINAITGKSDMFQQL